MVAALPNGNYSLLPRSIRTVPLPFPSIRLALPSHSHIRSIECMHVALSHCSSTPLIVACTAQARSDLVEMPQRRVKLEICQTIPFVMLVRTL